MYKHKIFIYFWIFNCGKQFKQTFKNISRTWLFLRYTRILAHLYTSELQKATNKQKKTLFYFKNNFFKRQRDRDDVYVFWLFLTSWLHTIQENSCALSFFSMRLWLKYFERREESEIQRQRRGHSETKKWGM